MGDKYTRVLHDALLSIDQGQNLVVIRTVPGMAMGVAAALDALKWGRDTGKHSRRRYGDVRGEERRAGRVCGKTSEKYSSLGGKMLVHLHVKNLALIQDIEVEFGPGLNILTGETGAGKSILLGSMQLIWEAGSQKT